MGRRNYLVEGVSGTGKTSVCDELQRRGYHAVHGDRELAYQGDPATGAAVEGAGRHEYHLWRAEKVRALVADQDDAATFFCGGSRNYSDFTSLFDRIFVLEVDLDTLRRRLDDRPEDEFGGRPSERELIERLHQSGEDTPPGIVIDATAPLARVVDQILDMAGSDPHGFDVAKTLPVVQAAAVERVVSAEVGTRVTEVRRISGFVGNEDFLVDTATGGYVLKAGAAADVAGEAWACQRVRQEGVAAPEVVGFDSDGRRLGRPYVLLRRLPGAPSEDNDPALVEAGRQLRIVHSIRVDRFGFFKNADAAQLPPTAPERAWSDVFTGAFPDLVTLQTDGVLPAALADRLRRAVTTHRWAEPATRPGVLLHGDLHPRHVFTDGGHLTGIIDWGDAAVGDPLFDLGRLSRTGSPAIDLVLRGYQDDNPLTDDQGAAVVFYRVLWSMLALVWEHRAGGDWFAGHLDAIAAGLSALGL